MADRLFLALPLDPPTVATFKHFQEAVNAAPKGFRWIDSVNWHITLQFIGKVEEEKYNDLVAAAGSVLSQVPDFHVAFDRYQLKFSKKKPVMVWATYQSTDFLNVLVSKLHRQMGQVVELEPLRPKFIPHVTLARIKNTRDKTHIKWEDPPAPGHLPVKEVILFRSKLTPDGSIYTPLHTFPLSAGS